MKKFFVALAALSLVACGGVEHEDLQTWMDGVSNDKRGQVPPLPEIKVYQPVSYTVDAKMDPFSEAKIEPDAKGFSRTGKGGLQPDFEARELRNSILEKYPLESMRMIGYLNINNQPMAAIKLDPELVKQVKVGDYIGLDFGLVTKVTDLEVELKEIVEGPEQEWVERINTLQLQAEEGGK